ncbi:hypothetical protein NMY22_g15523 [Coprinellus aureogranulatus]|nr:hypothetical protein NMY22_g15523 [Coprinellus aureogranulatus]
MDEASSNLELHRCQYEQVDPIIKGFVRLEPQQQILLATTSYALSGQALAVADASKDGIYRSTQAGAMAMEEIYYQAEEGFRISKTRILRLLSYYARHGQDQHYETLADQVVTLEEFLSGLEPYFTRYFGLDPACAHRQATAALR